MKVTMLLADAAQSVGGKLYILGGGWSVITPGAVQMAIAAKFEVPWDRANDPIALRVELLDEDGDPVLMPSPSGEPQPVLIEGEVEAGRPPGLRSGTPLDVPMAINIGVVLEPDRRYVWRLSVDGQSNEHWQCAFTTRKTAP